jgi:hypothetical protein
MVLSLTCSADGTWTPPRPLPKGEDEGEGLFFCRSSSANQDYLATRSRALGEPDDSKIAIQQVHGGPGILTAVDREFCPQGSYARCRPTR